MGLDVGEIGMPLDLGLDLKLFVAKTAGRLAAKDPPAVDACIRGLEEERRKIEVFQRELPLCVRLLAQGMPTNQSINGFLFFRFIVLVWILFLCL
jgi:hypothetical protein